VHDSSWLLRRSGLAAELAALPLFESLPGETVERVADWASEVSFEPGETVTRRWDAARDFYVVLSGSAVATRDGEEIAAFGPGDFFGELAALDWGAGYGYARLLTISAAQPLRLLVLAPAHLARLMAEAPLVDERVRRAVRERLPAVAD
jgi:cAMP-dependent protein kinase regulator